MDLTSQKQAPVKEVPVKEVPVKEVPVKEVPVKEVPVKEIPVKEVPVKEIPVKEIPVKEVPVKEVEKPKPEPPAVIQRRSLTAVVVEVKPEEKPEREFEAATSEAPGPCEGENAPKVVRKKRPAKPKPAAVEAAEETEAKVCPVLSTDASGPTDPCIDDAADAQAPAVKKKEEDQPENDQTVNSAQEEPSAAGLENALSRAMQMQGLLQAAAGGNTTQTAAVAGADGRQ